MPLVPLVVSLVLAQAAVRPPEQRVATRTGPSEITLTWQAQPGVREYRIWSDIRGNKHQVIARISGNGNRYVVSIPAGFAAHSGKVRKVMFWIETVGGSQAGERAAFNPIDIAPVEVSHGAVKPPRLVEAAQQGGSVVIKWGAVPGATGYAIVRQAGRTGMQTLCASCPAETTYVDQQPVVGETNVYEVMTVSAGGRSRPQRSNGVRVKPPPGTDNPKGPGSGGSVGGGSTPGGPGPGPKGSTGSLAAPTNTKATLSGGIVHLSWTPTRAARGYRIIRNGEHAATLGASASDWSEGVGRFFGELHYEIVALGPKESSPPARFNPVVLPKVK